ncbi:uncharacterized protein with GYD domain [Streptomyces sp. BK340]|nr:uncharacterized protein with GYD domain [Streptomyces sp. BK340]
MVSHNGPFRNLDHVFHTLFDDFCDADEPDRYLGVSLRMEEEVALMRELGVALDAPMAALSAWPMCLTGESSRALIGSRRDSGKVILHGTPDTSRAGSAPMPKFLIQATYTPAGAKGLLKEGASGRRAAVDHVVAGLGGTVEAMYFSFGEDDLVCILDFPDPVSMAAASLSVKASGAIRTRATPLLTLDEIDEAARRQVDFRPPGA